MEYPLADAASLLCLLAVVPAAAVPVRRASWLPAAAGDRLPAATLVLAGAGVAAALVVLAPFGGWRDPLGTAAVASSPLLGAGIAALAARVSRPGDFVLAGLGVVVLLAGTFLQGIVLAEATVAP